MGEMDEDLFDDFDGGWKYIDELIEFYRKHGGFVE
jgi:hypothetical protein